MDTIKHTTEYYTYQDEEGLFSADMFCYFSLCSDKKMLSYSHLLRILSDIAVEDCNQKNLSRETLLKHNYAILLSRLSLHIERLPKENEKFTIKTTEEKSEVFQFVRSYKVVSEGGSLLISGLSNWYLVNTETRRLLPLKTFTLRPLPTLQLEHKCLPCDKIKIEDGLLSLFDKKIVQYSDIDANGHVNNAKYIEITINCLPPEYQTKEFCDIRINYSKEALLGEELAIYGREDKEGRKVEIVGKVGETVSFEALLYYK